MMQVIIVGSFLHSSLALNHFINENTIDLAAVSESHGSVSGFESYDVGRSKTRKYCNALIANKLLKECAIEEL